MKFWYKAPTNLGVVLFLFLFVFSTFLYTRASTHTRVYAAPNAQLNFNARLLLSSGAIVADGNSYSIQFNLYDAAAGGGAQWTETHSGVTVKNGYLSVHLGSITPFPGTIDWSQQQWLTMNVNGDGEMNPRLRLTGVPLAFRANQADGITNGSSVLGANDIAQLAPTNVQAVNSALAALRLNQTGAGGLIQFQNNGTNVFTVANTGSISSSGNATFGGGTLNLGSASQSGGLALHDGSSNTGIIQTSSLGQNTTYNLPDPGLSSVDICLSSGNCGGTGDLNQGGNSFESPMVIGTNDAYALEFETEGTTKLSLDTSGNLNFLTGSLRTNGVTRLTNAGALQNVSGDNTNGVSFNANTITSGVLSDSRLSANVTTQGNTFNGNNQLVRLDSSGRFVAIDSSALTNLTAANITGQVAVANGGTGLSSVTAHGLLYGNGTSALGVATGTQSQLLLLNSSGTPTFATLGGDATLSNTGVLTLGNTTVTGGSYGSSTGVATFTVDSKGRLTAASTTTLGNAGLTNSSFDLSYGTNLSGDANVSLGGTLNLNFSSTPTFTSVTANTLASGSGQDITLNTNTGTVNLSANTTFKTTSGLGIELNNTTNQTLSLVNNGAGVANLNLQDGGLQIAGTGVLSNGRALSNLTGISTTGSLVFNSFSGSTGLLTVDGSGNVSVTASGTFESPLTFSNGLTRNSNNVSLGGTLGSATTIAQGAHNLSLTGTGAFSTATGSVSLNGNTSITGTNTLTVSGGLATLSGGASITSGLNNNNGGLTNAGTISGVAGLTFTSGSLNLASGGITNTGSIAGATTISATGAITAATSTNTINGLVINSGSLSSITGLNQTTGTFNVSGSGAINIGGGSNALTINSTNFDVSSAGALSGITTINASGAITAATSTNTINGLVINSGTLTGITGITFTSGSLNLASGGITNAGSIAGATTISASGAISAATTVNTINGLIINSGALSGISTINASGAITAATSTNTINGLVINSGALSNVTSLTLSGAISGGTTYTGSGNINTTTGGIQTSTVTRLTNTGALQNITTLGLSGAISGATATNTINGLIINSGALSGIAGATFTSGNLNLASGGITNAGSITGIGTNLTATGALTIANAGAGNNITINSQNQIVLNSGTGGLTFSSTGSTNATFSDGTNMLARVIDANASGENYGIFQLDGKASTGNEAAQCAGAGDVGKIYVNSTDRTVMACTAPGAWEQLDNAQSGYDNVAGNINAGTSQTAFNTISVSFNRPGNDIWIASTFVLSLNCTGLGCAQPSVTVKLVRGTDCSAAAVGATETYQGGLTSNSTFSLNFVDTPVSTGSLEYSMCIVRTSGSGSITSTLSKRVMVGYEMTKQGADYAEVYYAKQQIKPGTVLVSDSSIKAGVKGSSQPYQKELMGVVTTQPGHVLSDSTNSGVPVIVALAGRVPVRVSEEGGQIKAGDYLTSSSIAGLAMRATVAGNVIGKALSNISYDENGNATVMMIVANGWYGGDASEMMPDALDGPGDTRLDFDKAILANIRKKQQQTSVDGQKLLQNLYSDRVVAGVSLVTPSVTADDVNARNIDVNSIRLVSVEDHDKVLSLTRDEQQTFTVFSTGALELRLDATGAFTVKTASGDDVFSINTEGGLVQIGRGTSDGTAVLFVLDSKSTGGDPANAVNGASYYNESMGRFRCYQDNRWQDCLPAAMTEYVINSQPQTWMQTDKENEFPGSPRTWVDLSNTKYYRIIGTIAHTGFSATECRLQFASGNDGPWTNLSEVSDSLSLGTEGTVKSGWFTVSDKARTEVLLRVVCQQTNKVTTNTVTSIKLQVR